METNITAKEYKKALEEKRVFIVGIKYTRNGWTQFRVYIQAKEWKYATEPFKFVVVPEAGYWSDAKHAYTCGAWGTDRRLEIILSIGYALGLKFDDMPQRGYKWLQDTW